MKKVFICFTVLLSAITVLCAADSYPELAEIKKALRKQHPRLFITGDQLPAFRARANGVCKEYLLEMQKRVDSLPDQPVFEIKPLATLALLSMRATEPYKLTPQEIIEIEEHADLHGWVAPFTQEDHDSFVHFFSVFKRYNIVPSKATKLEFEFVIAMTEGELYAKRSTPKANSEKHT